MLSISLVLMSMLQIPLLGLRWGNIADALAPSDEHRARADMIAATAVVVFFAQVANRRRVRAASLARTLDF
jgi:hypothetical protein